ncbi:bifunctional UDP-sugar hydrolase/5'-nucleotidase [Hoeflea sp. TYP-13]|uniref:bifunctional UDP-sugar hydrolase/5'-nucleotidase n=1 Tax=Hoeflea sp. TYP-13 TaxID=3230023 RepID=UPI0034C5C104
MYLSRLLLAGSVVALSAGTAMADYKLNIVHINDLHSRIESVNKYDSTCSAENEAEGKCFGGIARVATKINELRDGIKNAGGNVIVLDAGDQFQGSLFYTTYKGDAAAEFMNKIGFDVMAVGNHEFDDGPEGLSNFLDKVSMPVISGNTDVSGNNLLAGRIPAHTVLDVGGEKIGIVSVLATDTDETSAPGPSVKFEDEIEHLTKKVAELEAAGVNKIIALTHVGFNRDQEIAAAVPGLDAVVGGHSHTLLSNTKEGAPSYPTMVKGTDGRDVPVVQAYAYSKYVGDLTLTFDDDGNLTGASGDTILLDSSVKPDAEILTRVKELGGPIEAVKSKVVAQSDDLIVGDRAVCRAGECSMGNLVTDAMLDRVKNQGIQIAFQNGGGLRASIDKGEVTMGEVLTVLPFQNTLSTFQIKGQGLIDALENGVSQVEDGAGRFPQVAGMKFTWDAAAEPGQRIVSVMVEGGNGYEPLDPAKVYGVVTNNYVRNGGDGYKIFKTDAMNAYDYGPGLEIVVADYLAANGPYKPFVADRITKK